MQTDTEKFITDNLKLVHAVCQKFAGEYDDLFQIGCIGLIKAARTFDPDKGYAFSSYATRVIRNEILMSLRRKRPDTISLCEPIGEDDTITLQDTIAGDDDTETSVIDYEEMRYKTDLLKSLLSPKYLTVLNGYLAGTRQIDIAREMGISRSLANRILMTIRKTGAKIDQDYQTGSRSRLKGLGRV